MPVNNSKKAAVSMWFLKLAATCPPLPSFVLYCCCLLCFSMGFTCLHCASLLCPLLRCSGLRARVQWYSRLFLEHGRKGFVRVLFVFPSCFVRNPENKARAVPEADTKQTRRKHEEAPCLFVPRQAPVKGQGG